MHKVGNRWYVYFSASLCNSDWGIVLPSLRVYALEGGTENPLSADYKISDPVLPPNYNAGMLDAACNELLPTHRHSLIKDRQTLFNIEGTTYFLASSLTQICVVLILMDNTSSRQLMAPKALTEHPSGLPNSFHQLLVEMRL